MSGRSRGGAFASALILLLLACSQETSDTVRPKQSVSASGEERSAPKPEDRIVPSNFFEEGILVKPGIFDPSGEATHFVLPFMRENQERFRGKKVLEIGTGSGVISLYAAKLGAAKVVATDIDPVAIECADTNAARMGFDEVIETRLVPPEDISAYSVIGSDEKFDVIISNPPYSLDLGAKENTTAVDTGDLGLSIIRGLPDHLEPGGVTFLLYGSLFYHYVMVKFAQHEGYEVRSQAPLNLAVWEAEPLFNSYLQRFLIREDVDAEAIRFDRRKDAYLFQIMVKSPGEPLMPGNSSRAYPGMMVIERK